MDLSLEQRLLRFLSREEEDERRSFRDLRSLPVEHRVLEGECVRGAVLRNAGPERFEFDAPENLSKFRDGDAVAVGDGFDFQAALPLVYAGYDAERGVVTLEKDRFARVDLSELERGETYCIDRRPLGIRGRLQDVVRAGFADARLRDVLEGHHELARDDARYERAITALEKTDLNDAQRAAGAAAIATESLALVQGPPGTGKTRLLAELIKILAKAGCRIALTAYTHRAVDNALRAIHAADPKVPLFKIGNAGANAPQLRKLGVHLNPRAVKLPQSGVVISGTCFAIAKMTAEERFHLTVFDEAGQMPIAHAMAGMMLAKRWVFFGDHAQLPPVITAHHADREVTESAFGRLHRVYGGELLDTSYRMNEGVCGVVSDTFYRGQLTSADSAASRIMPFDGGGRFDEILDPAHPVVLARVDHRQPGMRSPEEAALVADLCEDLVQRHGLDPRDIAVIAPFRAQVRLIRSALQQRTQLGDAKGLVVDTVERIQGQEREVVIVSLAVGDPDTLDRRAGFFFSTNRLNVALSRARTKAVLVASSGAFTALPRDAESLRAASVYKSLYETLPCVDVTGAYCGSEG